MIISTIFNLFRILVLPILFYLIYQESISAIIWAVIILLLAFGSTFLEKILRGKVREPSVKHFFDPFAEKITIIGLLLIYAFRGNFWWWVLMLFILRDLLVGYIRWIATRDDVLIEEGVMVRMLTWSQFGIALALVLQDYLFSSENFAIFSVEFMAAITALFTLLAGVLALVSLISYIKYYCQKIQERKKAPESYPTPRTLILVNKLSGSSRNRYRRHLLKVFSQRRKAPVMYLENKKNFYRGISLKIKSFDHIIIAGGDGTLESALNYSPLQEKSLGFFPLGSGNAFYSYFYRGKKFEYLRSRFNFREKELDVLKLEWNGSSRETTFLSVGLDAEVARLRNPKHTGFWAYFMASCRGLSKGQASFDLQLSVDGKKSRWDNCISLTLGKIPFYRPGMRSLLEVQPDDGLIYGLGYVNKSLHLLNKALRLWGVLLVNMGYNKSPIIDLKGKVIEARSEVPFPLQAGGEFLGFTNHIKVKVVRKQKVLMI